MNESDTQIELIRIISQIIAAVTNTTLYSPTHPQVVQFIDKAHGLLEGLLRKNPEITFLLIGDDLIADGRPLQAGSAYVASFTRILRKKAVERISFLGGVQKTELQTLINDMASMDSVSVRSSQNIKLGKVGLRVVAEPDMGSKSGSADVDIETEIESADAAAVEEELQELMALTETELEKLKETYLSIKKHRKIDVRGVDDMVKGFIKGFRQEINPLSLLANLKSVNEYTFTHVTNVCILTMAQAESLGFSGEHLHNIGIASLLHDVGKIFIPDEILSKPGVLTIEERRIIETHTVKGARYLMGIDGIPRLAIIAALEHHRKFDGSGYPTIKGGWTPNVVSQMIAIADVFDAMRSSRIYQGALPISKIVEALRKGSGDSYNPQFIDHFLRLIRHQSTVQQKT